MTNLQEGSTALLVGTTGIVGRELLPQLLAAPADEWPAVYAVSRRSVRDTLSELTYELPIESATSQRLQWVTLDLSDSAQVQRFALPAEWLRRPPTHLFFAGLVSGPAFPLGSREEYDANVNLLANALALAYKWFGGDVRASEKLKVVLLTGTKAYGVHVPLEIFPSFKSEFVESGPRHPQPPYNFYFGQEDLLAESGVHWCTFRPDRILSPIVGHFFSHLGSIAVYASVQKKLGRQLVYPGSAESLDARIGVVTAELVAKAMLWAARTGQCTNPGTAFNVANGDLITMRSLWSHVASIYQLEFVVPSASSTTPPPDSCVTDEVRRVWNELRATHSLERAPSDLSPVYKWAFIAPDGVMRECLPCVDKIRAAGFKERRNTLADVTHLLKRMADMHLVPSPNQLQ